MRSVDNDLGVGEIVEGGDGAAFDADFFMHHLDSWGDAVGRAGGRCDDAVNERVIELIVATDHYVEGFVVFDWGCDHDLFDSLSKISF